MPSSPKKACCALLFLMATVLVPSPRANARADGLLDKQSKKVFPISLAREIRVAQVVAGGVLREIPCQTHREVRRSAERLAKVLFMAGGPAQQRQTYLVFYGNPDTELPAYPTDLQTQGKGFALDIENAFFKASLSRQMGQRERMALEREHGLQLEELRRRLVNPPAASVGSVPEGTVAKERLARPGEAGDSPIPKKVLGDALRDCKDEQLADINAVDLGLVYDLRVRGGTVQVVMAMPHRGRPRLGYFAHGSGGNTTPIEKRLLKVPGVKRMVVEQTWDPGWSSNRLADEGRRKLGLNK